MDPLCELVVSALEVVEQLLVRRSFLQRVQLAAVQVLQQSVAEEVRVLGLAHDRRNGGEAGLLSGAPPPLAHHELVPVNHRPHDNRLENPDLPDRRDQFGQRALVEVPPWLARVGTDRADRHLGEVRTRNGHQADAALAERRTGSVASPAPGRAWEEHVHRTGVAIGAARDEGAEAPA